MRKGFNTDIFRALYSAQQNENAVRVTLSDKSVVEGEIWSVSAMSELLRLDINGSVIEVDINSITSVEITRI